MLFQQQRDLSVKQNKNVVSLKCILTLLYNTMDSKNRHIAESINESCFFDFPFFLFLICTEIK